MNEESPVDDACRGLKEAVRRYYKINHARFQGSEAEKQKLRVQIDHLVSHSQHILTKLNIKRASLKHAVASLHACWDNARDALKDSSLQNLRGCLNHLLQSYLRIGDGLVLLESGECRHLGDYPAKNEKYKTSLTKNDMRADGYTALYSKNLQYSGFGWDEFFDADHGVRARLLRLLGRLSRKATSWESLLDKGAQIFEYCLDEHETQLIAIRNSLEKIRERIKADLLQLLHTHAGGGGSVHFSTQDKMEYIEIKLRKEVAGLSSFKLQRRADEFQVNDEQGVLPDGWDYTSWRNKMALPTRLERFKSIMSIKTKTGNGAPGRTIKRRRVIEGSSDEEELNAFHIRESNPISADGLPTTSLNAIKTHMGVDGAELETARESLEAEGVNENSVQRKGEHRNIEDGRVQVLKAKLILKRAVEQNGDDPLEAWDARDTLREKVMQLGIDLLEENDLPSVAKRISDAQQCFKEAINLIHEQETAHKLLVLDTNDDTEGAWLIRRNLILLKGRAFSNMGLALLESSLVTNAALATRKKLRVEALKELRQAQKCVQALQERCIIDQKLGASAADIAFDIIKASQLETQTLKLQASVLWHNGKQGESITTFGEAAATIEKIEMSAQRYINKDLDFLGEYLQNLMGCYHSMTTLFDLIADRIDGLRPESSATAHLEELDGQDLLEAAGRAAERMKTLVGSIEKMKTAHSTNIPVFIEQVLIDHGVLTIGGIDTALHEVQERWKQRKEIVFPVGELQRTENQPQTLPRNGIGTGLLTYGGPRKCFVVSESVLTRASQNGRRNQNVVISYHRNDVDEEASPTTPMQLMKWGDQLFLQGKRESKLQYPSCAPSPLPGFPPSHI